MKSSVQRNIRASILEQLPLLSQPAYREQSSAAQSSAPIESSEPAEEVEAKEEKEEVEEKGSKKKGGGKSKGGKKGGKGKDKKEVKEDEDEEGKGADEGEVLLIDEIWPKKEALGLTKWYVQLKMCRGASEIDAIATTEYPFTPSTRSHCFSITLMGLSSLH